MKILITGSGGMLGNDVYKTFKEKYTNGIIIGTDIDLNEDYIEYLDVRNYNDCYTFIRREMPDIILHLAALTDLEYCEINQKDSWLTNALGTENIALICKEFNIKMVYISTAGIFDGQQELYTDFDTPNPLSHYGKSKYYGEKIVQQLLDKYFIFRAGWMMGGNKKDKKFIGKILNQIDSGKKELFVVDDKFGTPTYTKDFALSISKIIDSELYGLYNLVCGGSCSRLDVALKIKDIMGLDIKVTRVDSDFFKDEYFATRPFSEKLINLKLNTRDLNYMRDWEICLKDYLEDIKSSKHKVTKEVVISGFSKKCEWIDQISSDINVIIYQKGEISNNNEIVLPNIGREPHTFFKHIIDNYDSLADYTYFIQDNPFEHVIDIIDIINNDVNLLGKYAKVHIDGFYSFYNSEKLIKKEDFLKSTYFTNQDNFIIRCYDGGYPQDINLDISKAWKSIFNEIPPDTYEFVPSCHLCISREHIHKRDRNFYIKILRLLETYERMPWIIERLMSYIFYTGPKREYTIGWISHSPETYAKYLGASLARLKGNYDVLFTSDINTPAVNYNDIISRCKTRWLILLHEDVAFSEDLLERIDLSIESIGDEFNFLGIAGPNTLGMVGAKQDTLFSHIETIDSCFIVIDTYKKILFDSKTFDDFHCYVEDYCIQTGGTGHLLLSDCIEPQKFDEIGDEKKWIHHGGATYFKLGPAWGKYWEYKKRLDLKYGREILTT